MKAAAPGAAAAPRVTLVEDAGVLDSSADVLALPIGSGPDGPVAGPGTAAAGRALGLDLMAFVSRDKATGAVGDVVTVPVADGPVQQVVLVGVGAGGGSDMRRAGAALARRIRGKERVETTLSMGVPPDRVRAFVEGLLLGSYSYELRGKSSAKNGDAAKDGAEDAAKDEKKKPTAIVLHAKASGRSAAVAEAVDRGARTAAAVCLARDLANTPSSGKTPAWLADQAVATGRKSGLDVKVWDEAALAAEGFGGLLAVGSGAAAKRGPRLIQLSYAPADAKGGPHVVIVGKGITFDTGGLSLKPSDGMVAMKADMAGGAAVIGAMSALRDLGIPVRVTGLVAAAENMPSGSAYRPGDVIRHYGGTTVEVLNTDAEGRLVLADALAYADAKLDPDYLLDLATLTGAATLALSRRIGALFTDDEKLAAGLLAASDTGGDRLWRMPLTKDYRIALESPIADLAHVPHTKHRKISGGAITAALFLQEFVGNRRWAHIDMAGPGKIDGDEHENSKGGTGYGVRLLLRWLESLPKR